MDFALIINLIINSSIMASLLVFFIIIVKSIFKNKIGAKWHYIIWFILLFRLAVPYVGYSALNISDLYSSMKTENTFVNENTKQNVVDSKVSGTRQNSADIRHQNTLNINNSIRGNEKPVKTINQSFSIHNFLKQLYISINKIKIDYKMVFLVWVFGIVILSLYSFLYNIFFWTKVKNGTVFTDQSVIRLLEECKEKLGVHTNISIIQTAGISIPAIFGVTRPWLLLPEKVLKNLAHERLRYIILHELAHLKRRDILVNWIAFLLQIIHWFNPFIWFAFYKMRVDRELACDEVVLMHLDRGEEKKYGHTILDMVELISGRINYAGIAGILEDKSQINDRISMISRFNSKNNKFSVLTIIIIVFLGSSILVNASDFTGNIASNKDTNIVGNILANKLTSTPSSAPTSTPINTPTSAPSSTPSNIKSHAENSIINESEMNTSNISKSNIIDNSVIKTTPNAGKDKGSNPNSTQITTKENKPQQQELDTKIEKPVIEVSRTPEEGVVDISTVYPGLLGTVEKIDETVINVNSNKDDVFITKVEPNINLEAGVETNMTFEVEYSLVSMDKAILAICCNVGGYRANSDNAMEVSIWEVSKGKGKYRFTIPVIPKRWENGAPFWVLGKLRGSDGPTIYNTNSINLGLK
jgi:beta-lactamase regulating signal transducer with metallopeptidase domain